MKKEALSHAAEVVAGMWNILPSKAAELATTNRPELMQGSDYLKIGRVTLPKSTQVRCVREVCFRTVTCPASIPHLFALFQF